MTLKKFVWKYKWLIVILLLLPVFPFLVFLIGDWVLHKFNITAGQWIAFAGTSLGYFGTVLLGTLAFWQNEKSITINAQLALLEEKRNIELEKPILKLVYLGVDDSHEGTMSVDEKLYYFSLSEKELPFQERFKSSKFFIELHLKNISEITCYDISIEKISIVQTVQRDLFIYEFISETKVNGIVPNSEVVFTIFTDQKFMMEYVRGKYEIIQIDVAMTNKNGKKFIEKLQFGLKQRQLGCWRSSQLFTKHEFISSYNIEFFGSHGC